MKKQLLLFMAVFMMGLGFAQTTWAKCLPIIEIPTEACIGVKYDLSVILSPVDPCSDCIKYSEVKWEIVDPVGGVTGYSGSPLTYVFTMPGVYKVCVYWHDYCTGADQKYCQEVTVSDKCCKIVYDIPTSACVGKKYSLAIKEDCDCIKYDDVKWEITDPFGGVSSYAGVPISYVFSSTGTYVVCVYWHDYCTGLDKKHCQTVTVTDCGCDTKIDIPTTICSGEKYNLALINPCDCIKPDGVKWEIFDPLGGVTGYGGNPLSYVFSIPGTYKVCVYWHDYCTGKDETYCQKVDVKDCCHLVIDIPTTLCAGEKASLAIKEDCDCIHYDEVKWQITDPIGGVTTLSGVPVFYAFTMVGTYQVCVYWHDYCTGEDKKHCQNVEVKDCCKVVFDIPTVLCAGEKYNLSIKDNCDCIDYASIKWEITTPGGATTGYGGNPLSYVFSTPGTYKVCVYWFDHCTGKNNAYCQDVIVKDCCTPKIDIPTVLCAGDKYDMSIKFPCDCISPDEIKWVVGDPLGGTTSYSGPVVSYVFSIPGVYKVCVYWYNHCTGKEGSYCQNVIVKDCCKPVINIPTTLCVGDKYDMSIKFDCDCISDADIKWVVTDPLGGTTSYSGTVVSYVFSTPGVYKVCVYWYNHCTDKKGSYCQNVNVIDCCKPVINIPTVLCVGDKYDLSIKFDCDCISAADIKWSITDPLGATTSYSGPVVSYAFTMVGTYKVCVKWFNHCTGKEGSYCQNVDVKDCCPTKISIPTEACSGVKYTLSITNACGCIKEGLVKWEITDPLSTTTSYSGSPLSYVFTTPGIYKVCVYWTNYCTGKDESYCQNVVVKDCCPTKIDIPTSICLGEKYNLSISNACDCIKEGNIKWGITDPLGSTSGYGGYNVSYVFSMVGTYHVCVYWYNSCTGKDEKYCQDVEVKDCHCICDMKISDNTATTDFGSGYILNTFHLNSGSKKVVGVDVSIPYFNYNWEESGCKFNCDDLSTGYRLGNIVKYSDINTYFPTAAGCFSDWWAREVDWKFPTPQGIDQDVQIVISVPPTDCKMGYTYCVKVVLHYDDCTICECTFCFKGDEVTCSCEPAGDKTAGKMGKAAGLTDDDVTVYPNPNEGTFTVKMEPTNGTKVISVMDMTGKTIQKAVAVGEKTTLEMKNVASGTYMVVVTGDGKTVSKRVVIANTK